MSPCRRPADGVDGTVARAVVSFPGDQQTEWMARWYVQWSHSQETSRRSGWHGGTCSGLIPRRPADGVDGTVVRAVVSFPGDQQTELARAVVSFPGEK